MKLRGAIFDFDGTLFDSMYVWDTAGADYLRGLGLEPEPNLDRTLSTMSLGQSAAYLKERYHLEQTPKEIMDGVNRTAEHAYFYDVQPKKGAKEFVCRLQESGVRLCIATATDRYEIEAALARCGMGGFFSEILTCTEVGSGKEEPQIFREALRRLGTSRDDTVVFEDACHAIETAKADGFAVAAVYDAHEEKQERIRKAADFFLNDLADFDSFWKLALAR
jgi:HAD superfamily hydrolase (TIGR01509 family)